MNAPRALAVLMHDHWCAVSHAYSQDAHAHADLWGRLSRDFCSAGDFEAAVQVLHEVDCEHAQEEGPRSLSRLSHLSALSASPVVRSWWSRTGRALPAAA